MSSRELSEWIAYFVIEREEQLEREAEARAKRALEELQRKRGR